jgi:hypothetical protein
MVMVVPAIVATVVSELVYVIAPLLLEVGATKLNGAFPNVLVAIENPERTVRRITVSVAVIVAEP